MALKWLPPQRELIKRFGSVGMIYAETRRQFGKTTTMAGVALKQMMKHKGRLVTMASASINVGKELVFKEAHILGQALDEMKTEATAAGMQLGLADREGKAYESIDVDGIADLFERSRLEMRLYHSRTVCSRTQIIAPNPATARGFSGDVLIDEIGFIKNFTEVWEAMEPIASRDPSFRVLMCSTPPDDEAHLCYKIGAPPDGMTFAPNGDGHWYRSQAGILTLRVDVWDAEQCGVHLYDLETRLPVTPEAHREGSLDKDGWDRNYALKRIPGGLVAMSSVSLDAAMAKGKDECLALDLGTVTDQAKAMSALKAAVANIAAPGIWGAGYDIATTTGKKSNPSGLTLTQRRGNERWARLIVRWKSADPAWTITLIQAALDGLKHNGGTVQKLCIDGSNERFYATQLASAMKGVSCELVLGGEVVEVSGQSVRRKEQCGNLLVNLGTDRLLALPSVTWVKNDFLLAKKDKGLFVNALDTAGNHGDTFDSTKLSVLALNSEGRAEAIFPQRDGLGSNPARSPHPSWLQRSLDFVEGLRLG
jgi:hypothetical protein